MAGDSLAIGDSRLFLFQALKFGVENGIIPTSMILKLREEAADLSVEMSKMYKPINEADQLIASWCVLGVLNFSLIKEAGQDKEEGAKLIRKHGFIHIFRIGWTEISKTKKLAEKAGRTSGEILTEKDMAELLIAEPGRPWHGMEYYNEYVEELLYKERRLQFNQWLNNSYSGHKEQNSNQTFLLSLLVHSMPKAPLDGQDISSILEVLHHENCLENWQNTIKKWGQEIPEKFRDMYEEVKEDCRNSISSYKQLIKEGKTESVQSNLLQEVSHDIEVNDLSKMKYEQSFYVLRTSNSSADDAISFLSSEDPGERMAAVDYLLSQKGKDLELPHISEIIGISEPERWKGNIKWSYQKPETVRILMDEFSDTENILHLAQDYYVHIKEHEIPWEEVPLKVTGYIFLYHHPARKELLGKLNFGAEEILDELEKEDDKKLHFRLFWLLGNEQFYEGWLDLPHEKNERLFSELLNSGEEVLEWSKKDILKYLARKIKYIKDKWRKEEDVDLLEHEAGVNIKNALYSILDKKEYNYILSQIQQEG
jgi:hypothetical protein